MNDPGAYRPRKPSRTRTIAVRDAVYQLREWGADDAPPLILLHGTRDTSITFQFLVDALRLNWRVIAPDWRGHGGTESTNRGGWFHDYLADLDVILNTLFPDEMTNLVGHSLGGNLASTYAGLRPDRVRNMIALDAFGIIIAKPDEFVGSLSFWLSGDGAAEAHKVYESWDAMAAALRRANPRLSADRAAFLAMHSSRSQGGGGFAWAFNQRTRRSIPTFHSLDEWAACWGRLRARSLWVAASDPRAGTVSADRTAFGHALDRIGRERVVRLADSGHNLQHDQPEAVAAIIESFMCAEDAEKIPAVLAVPSVDSFL